MNGVLCWPYRVAKYPRSLAGKPLAGFRATPRQTYSSLKRRGSVCNTLQDPTVTSTIDVKKTTAWGESGFPARFLENVPDFAQAQGGAVLIALIEELRSRGYGVHLDVLEAWRFRVPQHRSRLFVVGITGDGNFQWPRPTTRRQPTVGQAIGDLPVVQADDREEVRIYDGPPHSALARLLRRGLRGAEAKLIHDHVTRAVRPDDADIYRLLKPGDTYLDVPEEMRRYRSDIFRDKYLRLSFESLSRTITAHIAKDGYWYIHPREDRTLSIREAARIQTFPDRFQFAGHQTSRYRQIGNAVPPLLAAAVASSVRSALESGPTHGRIDEHPPEHGSPFRDDLVGWFKQNEPRVPLEAPGPESMAGPVGGDVPPPHEGRAGCPCRG